MTETKDREAETILAVDDTPANLRLLHRLLGDEGYAVRLATGGDLALRSIREEPPDLVLLDVRMPGMDGFAVCRALKADDRTAELPVIFISALSDTEHKLEAFAVGGADYVTKPFQSAEVLARVRTHLELARSRRALQELNDRLRRSNEDLARVAYVISHDLKEPLRMMSSFSELLGKHLQGSEDKEADIFVGYILDGAARMGERIDGLLDLARVESRGREFEPTDCGALVEELRRDLGPVIEESGATLDVGPLPTVRADRAQLRQVFQNLIANALKYRGEAPPRVTLRAERRYAAWEISVADNGIGIDPKHYERIFVVFQRLHTRQEYPGTGMGLSMVKRIVERHGGEIRVESAPGEGTTFTLILPADL